ncbi:hypothetical protein CLU79DRAFT_176133 [Phycomyces nitens]|nr:hypothetical protein CLU79DRAFT_176133 [Phycomyces nitens]
MSPNSDSSEKIMKQAAVVQKLLADTLFPPKPSTKTSPEAVEKERQKNDPLQSHVWRMYTKAKDGLPNGIRMENLTWRMMAMSLIKNSKATGTDPDTSPHASDKHPSGDVSTLDRPKDNSHNTRNLNSPGQPQIDLSHRNHRHFGGAFGEPPPEYQMHDVQSTFEDQDSGSDKTGSVQDNLSIIQDASYSTYSPMDTRESMSIQKDMREDDELSLLAVSAAWQNNSLRNIYPNSGRPIPFRSHSHRPVTQPRSASISSASTLQQRPYPLPPSTPDSNAQRLSRYQPSVNAGSLSFEDIFSMYCTQSQPSQIAESPAYENPKHPVPNHQDQAQQQQQHQHHHHHHHHSSNGSSNIQINSHQTLMI